MSGMLVGVLSFAWIVRNDPRDVAAALRIHIENAALPTIVNDREGRRIGAFTEEARYPIKLDDIPLVTQRAFLAAEDVAFYQHTGVSWKAVVRAFLVNLKRERLAQGGSTITQQLVRQYFLDRDRSFVRKFREINLAWRLERQLSKRQILELWLNGVYLGNNAWGVEAAAQHYFRKSVVELSVSESALLAGLPQAPSRYAPHLHPGEAKKRKDYVLRRMAKVGWLDHAAAKRLIAEKVHVYKDRGIVESSAPWVTELARAELWRRLELRHLPRSGLKVMTNIQRDWQWQAQKIFEKEFKSFQNSGLESAMAVVDVGSGEIRTIIGGLNHRRSQFNRATSLQRPYGGATFPLIFAWAMDQGITMLPGSMSLGAAAIASRFSDGDRAAAVFGYGAVRERFVQLGLKVKNENLIEQVQGSPLGLALAWRVISGRPLTFNGHLVKSVVSEKAGNLLLPHSSGTVPGISEASAFAIKTWLAIVGDQSGAHPVARFRSDSSWNHWEIAVTSSVVAVVWVGADQKPTGDPERFRLMKDRASIAMDQWLEDTQNLLQRPQKKVPAGLSWHLLKTRDGRTAHVPFPTMVQ